MHYTFEIVSFDPYKIIPNEPRGVYFQNGPKLPRTRVICFLILFLENRIEYDHRILKFTLSKHLKKSRLLTTQFSRYLSSKFYLDQ